jgi:membrane carboxypeptidase/penicillin-binding protein
MPTRIFDSTGEILIYSHQNPNAVGSQYIPFDQIPEDLIEAILITTDPEFWVSSYFQFPFEQDISPITLSLVTRFLFENNDNDQHSEFVKNLIAIQVEKIYGKEKILEWYLNTSDFGNLAYGIDRASRVYFGKTIDELNLAEYSMLAAIIKAPGANPIDSLTLAKQRQEEVLDLLVAADLKKEVQANKAYNKDLELLPKAKPETPIAETYIDFLLKELNTKAGVPQLMYGGIDVISTLNYDLQLAVECTAAQQIEKITGSNDPDSLSISSCEAGRLLPSLGINDITVSDDLQTSIVILDSSSGEVLAYLGDPLELKRPGTIISPFIYLTAFTRGYSPATMTWDIPANTPMGVEEYLASNSDYFGPVRIRTALSNDLITPALHTLSQVGIENVWFTANNSGVKNLQFSSGANPYKTIFSENSVNLLELTHAYSLFSNNGKLAGIESDQKYVDTPSPVVIRNIYINYPTQNDNEQISTSIISPEYSYLVTDILSDSISRLTTWNAGNPLELGFDSAVMASSSANDDQHFIIGYSSDLTIGVWVGYSSEKDTNPKISKYSASGLWHALMRYAHLDSPPDDFQVPPGIKRVEVCDPSGMLPTNNCPKIVSEVFVDGSEPKYPDTFFKSIQINEQTGLLATVTTPPELIIDKVYMDIPEEALSWAFEAGIEISPSDYDLAYQDTGQNPNVSIKTPANFAYVNGEVEIIGNAKGPKFDSYQLEFGQGISPQQWLQIGETNKERIFNDVLTVWDTSDLEGLYALRLQVLYTDYSIITDVVQITIDNQNPHLNINFPEDNAIFDLNTDPNIPIQISVSDNISISHVEFFINEILLISLTDQPFTASWTPDAGEFMIEVIAYDEAGNSSSAEISITVD